MMRRIKGVLSLLALVGLCSCGSTDPLEPSTRLETFSSGAEFDLFIRALISNSKARSGYYAPGDGLDMAAGAPAAESNSAPDSITNNQEIGVDEGDIIKAHGEHLVILRRGRLFSVKLGQTNLKPAAYSDAFPKGSKMGTWYDEMLIYEDTIVVVGYSYAVGATEIGLFTIDAQGEITHKSTHFLRSNDYYSSRNYASRLVKGKLVFYMPYFLLRYSWKESGEGYEATLPGIHSYLSEIPEGSDGWKSIISKTMIYKPVQPVSFPALHTVVTCDLDKPQLSCSARGIIGPYARSFYVSTEAVYLWITDNSSAWTTGTTEKLERIQGGRSVVYRLPLDGSLPGVVRATGSPTDQFSFKESDDGFLNVLVRAGGNGDWMWSPEVTGGGVGLIRIPLGAFKGVIKPVTVKSYTTLTTPSEGYIFQNRFVGDHVLYGTGNGWWNAESDSTIYVYPYKQGGKVTSLKLQHSVDRIEVMGKAAVVVGSAESASKSSSSASSSDLHFTAVALNAQQSQLAGSYVEPNAVQGETRSHGFFYKQTSIGNGVLGLPVRVQGQGWNQLVEGSAKVVYLRVLFNQFMPLGSLAANPAGVVDDKCVASCVDWYGNARPIFYQDRILALLGYELVEGHITSGQLTEKSRADISTLIK